MGDDGQPVAFANVTITGERPKITGENGEVEIGVAARATFSADVRRLGQTEDGCGSGRRQASSLRLAIVDSCGHVPQVLPQPLPSRLSLFLHG